MHKLGLTISAALLALTACGGNDPSSGSGEQGAGGAAAGKGLPAACAILEAADLSATFAGAVPPLKEQPAASNEDVKVTHCNAYREADNVSIGLLVREQLTDTYLTPSADQAKEMIATTAPGGVLEGLKFEPVTGVGEAALWSQDSGQLNVFYRGGRAYFIVTVMNAKDNQAAARALADQVVAKYP